MKTNRRIVIYILIFIYIIPNLVFSEEITTDVIIVIKEDKVVAFSGQNGNWVPHNLRLNEEVLLKKAHGNVGVVITNERLYGFSAITGRWNIIGLLINEKIEDLQAEGNVATVVTDQRTFGFNANTGQWSEYK